ncbi:COPII coat assembly protein sec16-like isoform X2 [Xiphophorus hellerii]|uniref:COPII coat assembly protein sec16-like isoform X2 n=1 Tax=Xiphophorus hellerii TaxID=8084 RepID=UPI0013B35945|nr:COPII coat assembly protein sec16-like isoform X2 [Xiphophorus hellerii]
MNLWCFIVSFSLTCCLVSGQNAKYVLVGEKVDFPGFSDNKESPADILWKHVEGQKVYKVVHFDSRQEQFFGSYEGRATLGWRFADLSISNLRYEDSGSYDLEILINNQHLTKRYELIVIDKVTKPTISCEINNASTSESPGKATLLCSLPSHSDQSSLRFQWSTNANIHLGHMMKISLGGEFDDRQYNCTVNNPLSQDSAVFFAKDCYPETKAQAGLIAGVVVAVVVAVLLLILLLVVFFCLKKVRSNREKSDLETQSNSGFLKATSGSEESQGLLDRAPTLPSKHALGHLNQRNDTLLDPSQKDSEKNKAQDSGILFSPSVKQLRTLFEKENGKANEAEPREVVKEEVLENNPSDSETMNPELIALPSESNSEKNKVQDSEIPFSSPVKQLCISFETENGKANEAEPREVVEEEVLENNPSDSETMDPELIALSSESSPEKNNDEDNKALDRPPVPPKSKLVQNLSALQKVTKNTNPKVIKKQSLDDPADSGNPNEVSNDQSLSEKPEDSGNSSLPEASPRLGHPCTDDKKLGDEDKFPDILDKEDIPINAEETKDALPGSEKNKDEDNGASHPPSVSQKSNLVLNFSALKKATENTDPEDKRPVSNDPSDSGNPNEVPENQSLSEKPEDCENSSLPEASPRLGHPCTDDKKLGDEDKFPDILDKEDIPIDAEETKDALPGSEKNKDEDNGASHPPSVSQKSNLVRNFSALKKATENTDPEDKRPVSNDPSDSGNPNEVPENQNSGSKKEENEFAKSTPENDVQPPPVAKENSPLSQNSPESSPKAVHKQDIDSDECVMTSSGESSSSSLEESENEEQVPPASTPKKTDSETTVEEQQPALSETESEMETLQNK